MGHPESRVPLKERALSPVGLTTGWRENVLSSRLTIWADKDGTGIVCSCATAYKLPNGSIRAPDTSWIRREKLATIGKEKLAKFAPVCPDFVGEVRSPSDDVRLCMLAR